MMVRKGLVGAAAAVLALGTAAWAADSNSAASPDSCCDALAVTNAIVAEHTPVLADAAAPTPPVLTNLLNKTPVGKPLSDWGISITGYVEAGYLYDFTVPRDVTPGKSFPSDAIFFPGPYKNAVMLNQVDLNITRAIDPTKGKFDVGGTVELNFGRDATFIHSNGILDSQNKDGRGGFSQFDLEQAFITLGIPTTSGQGIVLTLGKFVTPMGYETINPTLNPFYTHSYLFSYAVPLTQTGITGEYIYSDKLNFMAGITRGWNQSSLDNNSAIDFIGNINYIYSDKLSFTSNLSVGPEATKDDKDYWFVPEAIAKYQFSDQLKFGADLVYGFANHMSQWYGIAGYAGYTISSQITANGRLEYYHDGRGFTTGGFPTDLNFWEATAGVAVTPLPDNEWFKTLTIRPELRFDMVEHHVFDGRKFNELTAAIDAYWQF